MKAQGLFRRGPAWGCLLVLTLAAAPAGAQVADEATALYYLQEHRIGADSASLEAFLENGFPSGALDGETQQEPEEKCQLLIYAMELVGKRGDAGALNPLGHLARGTLSPGIQQMIQRDARLAPAANRLEREQQLKDFLQYNAAVALGLIGDTRAAPLLLELYQQTPPSNERCQYALSLACLGDASGLDYLFIEVAAANQTASLAAAVALYYIAELDFGYRAGSPVRLREKLAKDYQAWWESNKPNFRINPRLIIKRRLDPLPTAVVPPTTVRNLVALAADYLDFTNKRGSRTAQDRLDEMEAAAPGDLRKALESILDDEMEDLTVRREAMRRYVKLRGKDAKKTMKNLLEDENPEIRQYAENALESLESGIALSAPSLTAEVVK